MFLELLGNTVSLQPFPLVLFLLFKISPQTGDYIL